MTADEDTASPWWGSGGADQEFDDVFKCHPELLGTSWGSYLCSVPPTARSGQGRSVVFGETQSRAKQNGACDRLSTGSVLKRSNLRTPTLKGTSKDAERTCHDEPRPPFHRLSTALIVARETLISCGIDGSPLGRAYAAVTQLPQQQQQQQQQCHSSGEAVIDGSRQETEAEECVLAVLEALVSQCKKLQEYATSLQHTATVLTRNQRQFSKDQQDMQHVLEAAFSDILTQQQILAEKKNALTKQIKEDICQTKKTYVTGLREGQHRVALMQVRKEQSRLEKMLRQQQRELSKLQQAYKKTKSELATEQYSSEKLHKKLHESELSEKPSQKRIHRLRKNFNEHNHQLHQLECQLEASRQELAETGSRLRAEERKAHIPVKVTTSDSSTPNNHVALNFPPIPMLSNARNQRPPAPPDQLTLPRLCKSQQKSQVVTTNRPKQKNTTGHWSRSELLALAKFRSPETAEQVINWLEREGHLSRDK